MSSRLPRQALGVGSVAAALVALVALASEPPFHSFGSSGHLGLAIARVGQSDLQPTIMYEPEDSGREFKMWWYGQKGSEADPAPANLHTTDRIFYSYSQDGSTWSTPVIALAPRGGVMAGDFGDDHQLGSPSVIKVGGTYYMFYEGYGTYATQIVRWWHPGRDDYWGTSGALLSEAATQAGGTAPLEGYVFNETLGYAPRYVKSGTHPVYSCQVAYANGQVNKYLKRDNQCQISTDAAGTWTALNGNVPVFWAYTSNAEGAARAELLGCWRSDSWDTYEKVIPVGTTPTCHPDPYAGSLGYLAASTTSPDMIGANQNRIMMATSSNGVSWNRFVGAARGSAMVAPLHEGDSPAFPRLIAYPNHSCGNLEAYDVHRSYGAGYPAVLVRDSYLELYYKDDSASSINNCAMPTAEFRVKVDISKMDTAPATAYTTATPEWAVSAGDIKWSQGLGRYFVLAFDGTPQRPSLVWTAQSATVPLPTWAGSHTATYPSPRTADYGGILGTALGHTVDFPSSAYTAFHLYYPSFAIPGWQNYDIDHYLLFGWWSP